MKIITIDLQFQGMPGIIAAHLVESAGEFALIETGPDSCRHALLDGLRQHGVEATQIKHVFVTHIHLDHAGGAGWWAQQGSQVYVHPKGAPHLIAPSKLIESASRIYGDRMQSLWGDILPAPAERVTVLHDNDRVQLGAVEVIAWDTPGHARHHHAYVIDDVCFTGDVAGVRLANSDYLSVAAAPPQFEPEPYIASVERLRAAKFRRLYLAHFGEVTECETHLKRYAERIREVHGKIAQWKSEGASSEDIASRFTASERAISGLTDEIWQLYESSNGTTMCAGGIELYVTKSAKA